MALEAEWAHRHAAWAAAYPELAAEFDRRMAGNLPDDFTEIADSFTAACAKKAETIASRKAQPECHHHIHGPFAGVDGRLCRSDKFKPHAVGENGSGDGLQRRQTTSTTACANSVMAAIMNGLLAHGGVRPFGGTYVMFSEYARNAMRMAALMKLGVIYVLSHDSIALGQDGPTHQPIEQLATLRMIPNMDVWRPCGQCGDFHRLAHGAGTRGDTDGAGLESPGANLADSQRFGDRRHPQGRLCPAQRKMGYCGPSSSPPAQKWRWPWMRPESFLPRGLVCAWSPCRPPFSSTAKARPTRSRYFPGASPRISVEAGVTDYWRKYVGLDGLCIGIDTFGESAAAEVLFEHFGLTTNDVAQAVRAVLSANLDETVSAMSTQ